MTINAVYLIAGLALFLAAVLPAALKRYAVSAPMVLLSMGLLIGLLPLPEGLQLDPIDIRPQIQRVSELAVLVALMGVGLALDRPSASTAGRRGRPGRRPRGCSPSRCP